ncbi:MAG: hypothetical protein HW414_1385 [Dehalococcoidia bacterium]|nr:hypothetical protein [Dehalococcoidia bacterium]
MGRPWWYDSYWQKKKPPRRRLSPISRRSWVWIGLVAVAVFLAAAGTNFSPSVVLWLLGFITYLCRILALAILVRAILSWFSVNRYNLAITLLDDLTEPVLSPLRRAIPPFGGLDFTPLIAMVVLYAIPSGFARLVTLFLP